MGPMTVVPAHEVRKLPAHRATPERNQDPPRAVVLQRSEEPLDDGDAAMLAHRSVAKPDSTSPTPTSVSSRLEHALLVAQQVARRRADVPDRTTEESAQCSSIGLVGKNHPSLNPPRVVVQNHDNPPTERPLLWQSVGTPRGPEAEPCRSCAQVNVPQFVRSPSLDDRPRCNRDSQRFGPAEIRSKEATHGGRCQMQSSTTQHLGDLDLAEAGTEQLQPTDDVADEVGKLVHRDGDLQQCLRPVLVDPGLPGAECRGRAEPTRRERPGVPGWPCAPAAHNEAADGAEPAPSGRP